MTTSKVFVIIVDLYTVMKSSCVFKFPKSEILVVYYKITSRHKKMEWSIGSWNKLKIFGKM